MRDLFHYVGSDLSISATGDLQPVSGPERGKQRVLRRLVTNPGDYQAHPDYGAGIGRFVGAVLDIPAIRALIMAQLQLESAIARTPRPEVSVTALQDGVAVDIRYQDVPSGQWQNLAFTLDR